MRHIYTSLNLATISSDNGLAPYRHQASIWTNAGVLLIGTLETNLSEILIEIHTFSFIQENVFENVVCKHIGHLVSASMS